MNIDIPAGLSNAALWAIILGFFAPLVLNLLLQSKWSARTQAILAFVFCLIVGTVTAFFAGAFTGVGIVTAVLLVFVVAISTYKGFWKPVAPNLKNATSVAKSETPEPLPVLVGATEVQETPKEASPVAYDSAAPIAPDPEGPKHALD